MVKEIEHGRVMNVEGRRGVAAVLRHDDTLGSFPPCLYAYILELVCSNFTERMLLSSFLEVPS